MTAVDTEDTCPFCGGVNTCMAKSTQPCWCIAATIPAGLVELGLNGQQRGYYGTMPYTFCA